MLSVVKRNFANIFNKNKSIEVEYFFVIVKAEKEKGLSGFLFKFFSVVLLLIFMLFYCLLFYELYLLIFTPLIRNLTDVSQVPHHTHNCTTLFTFSLNFKNVDTYKYTNIYTPIYIHMQTQQNLHIYNSQFGCSTLMSSVRKICSL